MKIEQIEWGDGTLKYCTGKECLTHDRAFCTKVSATYCKYIRSVEVEHISFLRKVD